MKQSINELESEIINLEGQLKAVGETCHKQIILIEKLENQNPEIGLLALALSKAQGEIESAIKDRHNEFNNSNYATLTAVYGACRKQLAENDIAVFQRVISLKAPKTKPALVFEQLETSLIHKSGQKFVSITDIREDGQSRKNGGAPAFNAQSYGTALTYARRYGLTLAVGIATDDDDGQEGAKATTEQKVPALLDKNKDKSTQKVLKPAKVNAPKPAVPLSKRDKAGVPDLNSAEGLEFVKFMDSLGPKLVPFLQSIKYLRPDVSKWKNNIPNGHLTEIFTNRERFAETLKTFKG